MAVGSTYVKQPPYLKKEGDVMELIFNISDTVIVLGTAIGLVYSLLQIVVVCYEIVGMHLEILIKLRELNNQG